MPATIINPRHDLGPVRLVEPPPYGYLLFGATVTPPKGPPIVREDATRRAVLSGVSERLEAVAELGPVVRATGYRAVVIPPARAPGFRLDLEPPRFDVVVLVETESPDSLAEVAASPPVTALRGLVHDAASRLREMRARCVKAIADVDKRADGTYLFNFWAAADRRPRSRCSIISPPGSRPRPDCRTRPFCNPSKTTSSPS